MQTCRICFEEGDDLLTPCACKGTAAHIHSECLTRWLQISRRTDCDICHTPYWSEEENRHIPSFVALYAAQHPFYIFAAMVAFYLEFIILEMHSRIVLSSYANWNFYSILVNLSAAIPIMVFITMSIQGFVMVPAILSLKNKGRYLRQLTSCKIIEGMRIGVPLYLSLLLVGLATSFHYPIGGSIMAIHFSSYMYDIHRLVVNEINKNCVQIFIRELR